MNRHPAVNDGSNFEVKVRATKVGDPKDGKVLGDSSRCETPVTMKGMTPGHYVVTVETDPDNGYCFDVADTAAVALTANTETHVTIQIKPLVIASVTPDAPWKQFINLEFTDKARHAGDVLVTHDEQVVRAAAALQAANANGRAEPKQLAVTEARKTADAAKVEADDLKGMADRGEARLEAGATATVEAKVKVTDPGVTSPARAS